MQTKLSLHTLSKSALSLPLVSVLFLLALQCPPRLVLAETSFSSSHTCTDAAQISKAATTEINHKLNALLTDSTFFSVFSVSLEKQCPFWDDGDAQCVIRECAVDNCPENDVPPAWRDRPACQSPRPTDVLNDVDRSLSPLAALVGPAPWLAADSTAWTVRDDDEHSAFVDLRRNPERFTGYDGPSSRRVWEAVYDENCFSFSAKCRSGICASDTCKEERVLYRLISGLHASISMHIAKEYLFGSRWAVNTAIYKNRIRDFPERIANLQVAYAVVLRAVGKASSALHPTTYSYTTGNDHNDIMTKRRLSDLFTHPLLSPGCEDKVFDESDMFIEKNEYLLPEFRTAFRNISMIMDCVGCEKCRLWGKLQFLGLGTALRILFDDRMPELERNEIIALLNLLAKLSTSVLWVDKMEDVMHRNARIYTKAGAIIGACLILLLSYALKDTGAASSSDQKTKDSKEKTR